MKPDSANDNRAEKKALQNLPLAFGIAYIATIGFCVAVSLAPWFSEEVKRLR
jgi:hypothetical protein